MGSIRLPVTCQNVPTHGYQTDLLVSYRLTSKTCIIRQQDSLSTALPPTSNKGMNQNKTGTNHNRVKECSKRIRIKSGL